MQDSYTPVAIVVSKLPVAQVMPVIFFLVFLVWAIYTLVAIYHWLRYSNNTTVALCALTTHGIVSALIAIYAVSGFVG
jgi:hypothetical protein